LLSEDLLEEIRLLTNLETTQHKLLQIVLAGQPELDQKLDSHQLRQLKQRVGLRCNLLPLELEDVEGYIRRRLELAGASETKPVFPKEVIEAIYRISKGIPRLINTLCENSLMLGYGLQLDQITPAIVQEVASDFRLHQHQSPPGLSEVLDNLAMNSWTSLRRSERKDVYHSPTKPVEGSKLSQWVKSE
jgi:hypothetical protein